MKRLIASWQRGLSLLPAAFAANTAFAAIPMPDLANIDWQRTGLLAGSIVLLAIVVALTMNGRGSARSAGPRGQEDDGWRRIGNMPVEPAEPVEPTRRSVDDELDPRRRVEGKLPGLPV